MFQFRASVADSGLVLNQYCVFGTNSWKLLITTIKIIQNFESMLF